MKPTFKFPRGYGLTKAEAPYLKPKREREDWTGLLLILLATLIATAVHVLWVAPWPPARAAVPANEAEACAAWRAGEYLVENVPAGVVAELCNSLGV